MRRKAKATNMIAKGDCHKCFFSVASDMCAPVSCQGTCAGAKRRGEFYFNCTKSRLGKWQEPETLARFRLLQIHVWQTSESQVALSVELLRPIAAVAMRFAFLLLLLLVFAFLALLKSLG